MDLKEFNLKQLYYMSQLDGKARQVRKHQRLKTERLMEGILRIERIWLDTTVPLDDGTKGYVVTLGKKRTNWRYNCHVCKVLKSKTGFAVHWESAEHKENMKQPVFRKEQFILIKGLHDSNQRDDLDCDLNFADFCERQPLDLDIREAPFVSQDGFDEDEQKFYEEIKLNGNINMWKEYCERSKKIEDELIKEMINYQQNPANHRQYEMERKAYWLERKGDLRRNGKDPMQHNIGMEFLSYWEMKLKNWFQNSCKKKKGVLRDDIIYLYGLRNNKQAQNNTLEENPSSSYRNEQYLNFRSHKHEKSSHHDEMNSYSDKMISYCDKRNNGEDNIYLYGLRNNKQAQNNTLEENPSSSYRNEQYLNFRSHKHQKSSHHDEMDSCSDKMISYCDKRNNGEENSSCNFSGKSIGNFHSRTKYKISELDRVLRNLELLSCLSNIEILEMVQKIGSSIFLQGQIEITEDKLVDMVSTLVKERKIQDRFSLSDYFAQQNRSNFEQISGVYKQNSPFDYQSRNSFANPDLVHKPAYRNNSFKTNWNHSTENQPEKRTCYSSYFSRYVSSGTFQSNSYQKY